MTLLNPITSDTQFPHCNPLVLHAPGECEYCDKRSDWQRERLVQGINFTGKHEPGYDPCPSEVALQLFNLKKRLGYDPFK